MNRYGLILIFSIQFIFIIQASSQVPFTAGEFSSEYNRAIELFNKEKYPAAIRLFDSYVAKNDEKNRVLVSEAEYFSAVSALKLFNGDAEHKMTTYIYSHPESPRLNEARLELGDYFYQGKNYRKAVTWYESVNRQELKSDKLAQYFFRLGYSLYMRGNKPRALLMFSEIKDIDTEFTPPAVYYFAQIAYEQQMYQTAMEGFMRLKDDETFGAIVPFYIVQILYLQKDYDGILSIAPDLVKSAGKERVIELYRFIGDAYYNKENYKEAVPYLEKYSAGARASGREDKYELGYCYYKTGDIDKAIKIFLDIHPQNDILSQNIWNILGDCYLKKGDKKRAQLAFGQASRLNFDKKIQEESLLTYAKLTYEISFSPFGEAIAAFQEYIDLYPGSPRIHEAYDYLVATFTQLKNYKAALSALDKIGNKDPRLEEAYQRVAFFRALELFKNLEFEASADMFDKSLKYEKYNRTLMARAIYWRGEAWYRLGQYDKSIEDYETFMGIPGSMLLAENSLVRYNLGYALYNTKDYPAALSHFRAFEASVTDVQPDILTDARDRIADCYFMATNYDVAISYYDKVIDYRKLDADYAMYQKGFSLGLMNDEKGKVQVLTDLTQRFPSSSYVPQAIYERGRAYLVMEDYKNGENDFNAVIRDYKTSPYVPAAMVQLGLLYYNLGENDKAIAEYKKVIDEFKSTPEARAAMTGLKNAYVDKNDVESYFSYIKTLNGYGDVNMSEKDSLLYTSGENLYISGKYDKASDVFQSYLGEFPNGSFRQNAQYYLAECLKSAGNIDGALKLYIDVANQPNNQFMEQSLLSAASILYDKEDYTASFDYYQKLINAATTDAVKLTAMRGALRSAYQAEDAQKTIAAAEKVLSTPNMPEELIREAAFMDAKANYSLNNMDEALKNFRKVAGEVTSIEGAESKYRVAEILYKKGQTAEAEKVINEFVSQNTPHQYWMARIFLLLSDICIKKDDMLQARATLQSLRDYYSIDNDGILDEVKAKLDSLNSNK
jgi:TolA-binding protein